MGIVDVVILAVIIALMIYVIVVNVKQQQTVSPVGNTELHTGTFEDHDQQLNDYVGSLVTGEHFINKNKNQEILLPNEQRNNFAQNFKNKYFEFRDTVNMTSDIGADPVDNINKFIYSDFETVNGKKIKDVYDEILNVNNGPINDRDHSNLSYVSDSGELLEGGNGKLYDGHHWIVSPKADVNPAMNDSSVNGYAHY